MKKLIIISLLLLGLMGLYAQVNDGPGVPYLLIIDLQTADGGIHEPGTIGFRAIERHSVPAVDDMWDIINPGSPKKEFYWNWPEHADVNTPNIVYGATNGRINIQMAPLTHWGSGVVADFWFIDASGTQVGPIIIEKTGADQQIHPDLISWGGPAAPEFPSWATVVAPLDGAMDVPFDQIFSWEASTEGTTPAGYEFWLDGELDVDLGDVTEYDLAMNNYSTSYTWSIKPYVWETPTEKAYPEGEMPVWTFTTMAEPVAPLVWAFNPNPADAAVNQPLEITLQWEYPAIDVTGFEVTFNNEAPVDVVASMSLQLDYLEYETTNTWSVKPYREAAAPSRTGMRASKATRNPLRTYPEGDMPVWTFTTEAAPIELPSLANYSFPENNATGVALDAELGWGYQGAAIDGFEVYVDLATHMIQEDVAADVFNFAILDLMYASEYSWSIRPYRLPETAKGMRSGSKNPVTRIYPEADVVVWSFTTTDEYDGGVAEIIPGTTVEVAVTVVLDGSTPPNFTPNLPIPIDAPTIELPAIAGAFNFGVTIDQSVPGTYTFTFTTDLLQGAIWLNGVKIFEGPFTGGVGTVTIYFDGAKAPKEIIFTESSLPVELASFTAVAHASQFVTLKWVTESESNLHGYNIYRAENASFNTAMRINPSVVVANNQAVTSTYTYTDNEVEAATYYYWLEVSELSNENTFHGPIVVTVEDDPVIPGVTATEFRNFGPSPFSETTSTSLRVKEGETASITIYNLLGQVVARESFNAGEHNFVFNGRDSNGKKVANGIYFVRMTSPTTAKNFKIIKMQ